MLQSIFRKLPPFRGKYRLARLLFGSAIRNSKDIVVTGRHGLKYKLPNLKENIGFNIYVDGLYEPEYVKFILGKLPPNGVLLDLGANIGSICIPIARLRPDVTILAVEASPRVFSYLKSNVEANGCKNIRLENFALSVSDNQRVAFYSPEEKFGKGSMSAVFTDKEEYITTITVDSLLDKHHIRQVDCIKIDVEGYESQVFKGGRRLLSRSDAPGVLFEFASWAEELANEVKAGDSQRILVDCGYKLFDVNNTARPVPLSQVMTTGGGMLWADKR